MKLATKKRNYWGNAFTVVLAMAVSECDALAVGDMSPQSVSGMARSFLQSNDQRDSGLAPVNPQFLEWCREQEHPVVEGPVSSVRSWSMEEEVNNDFFGHFPSPVDYSYLKDIRRADSDAFRSFSAQPLPSRYDLRQESRVTPVKDQGHYGTCWAHATLGSMESALLGQGRGTFDFSEKHLANTHGWDLPFSLGGNATIAMAYLTRWSGPIAETEDPYPDDRPYKEAGGVAAKVVVPPSPRGTPLGHVQNVEVLPPMESADDTEIIKRAVLEHGGVYASYTHAKAALSADGRTFYWNGNTNMLAERGGGGHAVMIVGWDDAFPRSEFKYTPPVDGAFLAKNSWGGDFGENGYFWVSYCDACFGKWEVCSFWQAESTNNYGDIYQHDPFGKTGSFGRGETMWGANVFVARKDDALAAVGFYANVPRTQYEISVYTDCPEGSPVGGTRRLVQSGVSGHCGYVTVPLDSAVPVGQGCRFSVVLKLTTPDYRYPLAIEVADFPTSRATSSKGESFYSSNGVQWTDYADTYPNGNICIKAYTKARGQNSGEGVSFGSSKAPSSVGTAGMGGQQTAFAGMLHSYLQSFDDRGSRFAPPNPDFVEWCRGLEHQALEGAVSSSRSWGMEGGGDGGFFGDIPDPIDSSYLKDIRHADPDAFRFFTAQPLPSQYDLRQERRVTSVKDQGNYGTCWAHATMGSLESALLGQGRGTFDFSEKHLANTHGWDWPFSLGGNGTIAMAYLTRWSGPIAESEDPYPDDRPYKEAGGVAAKVVVPASPRGTPLGHVQNVEVLPPMESNGDTEIIKRAVLEHGGVYASYTHAKAALSADGRTFYWNGNTNVLAERGGGGHAVMIVGWDDAFPRSEFKYTPPVDGAFLAKNSWGGDFGENGYFWVSYCDACFGKNQMYSFFQLEPTNNYGDIYQHDPLGRISNFGGAMTVWGANVFVARKDDALAAVGFYANVPRTQYEISVYTDCPEGNPVGGTRRLVQSGVSGHCGYVTVPLDNAVPVGKDRRFSVVLKLTTPGYYYPLSLEIPEFPMSRATSCKGESFVSPDGIKWMDFADDVPNGNVCIKAYTSGPDSAQITETDDSPAILSVDSVSPVPQADFPSHGENVRSGEGIWENLPNNAFKQAR